jgi:hypothetical protein
MRFITTLLKLATVLCVLPACESIESADLDTSGIWADIDVTHNGNGALEVQAELKTGRRSNTWLQLTDGDQLHAQLGDDTPQRMRGEELLSRFWYAVTFNDVPEDALVTVAFTREEKTDAPLSQVRMPLNFELTSPATNDRYVPGDVIAITWSNTSSDRFKLKAEGDCVETFEQTVSDNGRFEVPAADFTRRGEAPGCRIKLQASRIRGGQIDSAFDGGEMRGWQVRTVNFDLVLPTLEVEE